MRSLINLVAMRRGPCGGLFVSLCLLAASCGGTNASTAAPQASAEPPPQRQPIRGTVTDGELALTLGDPVRAIAILDSISRGNPTYAYAQELLQDARAEKDVVVEAWLEEIDTLTTIGRFRTARARCDYLLEHFPLNDAQQEEVGKRIQAVAKAEEEARERLAAAEQQARDLLLSNDLQSALVTLRGARDIAWEIDRERALEWERVIALTDRRYQDALAEGLIKKHQETRTATKRRRPRTTSPAPVTPPPDQEELTKKQELQTLLQEAASHVERQAHFQAIQTYESVLRKDPQNAQAAKALKALAPRRDQLVQEYLAKADQHFLRQDLEGAVPFYQKVLYLQPNHKRAVEGLRMHENLQKIKTKKRR